MRIKSRKDEKILIKQAITEKGITLIALVVTIVVLLILAGVTITMVLGEDGIIAQAKLAAEKTKEAEDKQAQDLKNLEEQLDYILDDGGRGEGTGGTTTPTPEPTPPETIKDAIEQHYEFKENKTYPEDGTNKSVTIPAGYYFADSIKDPTIDYEEENNPKIDEGIVITDKVDGEGKSTGNEFVWVPVGNINDMVMCQNHPTAEISFNKETGKFTCSSETGGTEPTLAGKLYATETGNYFTEGTPNTTYNANSGLREPAIVTGNDSGTGEEYDGSSQYYSTILDKSSAEDFKTELQEKFTEMAKSVAKYGGFYIGRYETGGLKAEVSTPVVQKYKTDINNVNWYCQYRNSKSIAKEGSGAISSMIWGCQWDATMKWFISCGLGDYVSQSKVDGEVKGNYKDNVVTYKESANDVEDKKTESGTGKVIPTGGSEQTKVKNIYDMAGNVYDWTIEAYNAPSRVIRGGDYSSSRSYFPASSRGDNDPSVSTTYYGSRATLYVNLKAE